MRSNLRWITVLSVLLTGVALWASVAGAAPLRIGVITDVHVHDTDSPVEGKVMTNYAERLTAFVDAMNAWPADATIQLGDLVNGAFVMGGNLGDPTRIGTLLDGAVALLSELESPLYHVLGNHDLYDLSKPDVLAAMGLECSFYSFDLGGYHFAVLDAQHNPDGTDYDHVFMRTKGFIPPVQLEWLVADLAATTLPTVVCVHQPIDSDFDALAGGPPIVNNKQVQQTLGQSGVVIAVLQGHDHENRYVEIDGIHYLTFAAMVDNTEPAPPTYARMTLDPETRTIRIEGFGLQESWELPY